MGFGFRNRLDHNDIAADLFIGGDGLARARSRPLYQNVRQEDGEGLVADDVTRAPDRVAQAIGRHLAHIGNFALLGKVGQDLVQKLVLALFLERRLKLEGVVEIVFHRALAPARNQDEVLDARRPRLGQHIVDQGAIHDGQHFLGRGLGGGQHAGAKTGDRENGFLDGLHKAILGALTLLDCVSRSTRPSPI